MKEVNTNKNEVTDVGLDGPNIEETYLSLLHKKIWNGMNTSVKEGRKQMYEFVWTQFNESQLDGHIFQQDTLFT